jgi:hypothetical protein
MLSNIVLIIILILLVIILVLLYFFSNDIRKNKNKINILESDINAIRERLTVSSQKITTLENNIISNKPVKMHENNGGGNQNFVDILEKLGTMNNDFYVDGASDEEDKEESDEEDKEESDEEESDEEDNEESDEEDNEEDNEESDEEENEESDEEDNEEENEESNEEENEESDEEDNEEYDKEDNEVSDDEENNSNDNGVAQNKLNEIDSDSDDVSEVKTETFRSFIPYNSSNITPMESSENVHFDEIKKEQVPLIIEEEEKVEAIQEKKIPKKSLSKLEIGTVEFGTDKKTKYIIQLNKAGRKYWKKV